MLVRVLETFFGHKLLILLPVVLIPILVVPIAWYTAPVYYEASASIWVGHAPVVASDDPSDRYLTPAQIQSGSLTEMLRTRWMQVTVAQRTAAANLVGSATGETKLRDMFDKDLTITASGTRLLLVTFRSPTPQLTQQFLSAVLDTYREKVAADRASDGVTSIEFYQSGLQDAQAQLATANNELRRYTTAHPELTAPVEPGTQRDLPLSVTDPTLAELEGKVQFAQTTVDKAQASLQKAQLDAAAGVDAQDASFQVIDPPAIRTAPGRDMKKVLIFPAASIVLALGLSLALLVVLTGSDRTVRTEADLVPAMHVLGTIPRLQVKRARRIPKALRPTATRRAIGFVAGTALPAPSKAA